MAWTNLTYSFGSLLTSTKMTQNQANFTALAEGQSGAPSIQGSSAVTTLFGDWIVRSFETSYLSSMDGIVVAHRVNDVRRSDLVGYTDSASTPTIIRVYNTSVTNDSVSISMPTKKGDYYRITSPSSAAGETIVASIHFLPMGI